MRRLLGLMQSRIRYKIILPYLALTLMVTMLGAAISLGLAAASVEDRLRTSLTTMGRDTTEAIAQRERDHLAFLWQLSFAQANAAAGAPAMADAFDAKDPALLEKAIQPYYSFGLENASLDYDRLIAFDTQGRALLDWVRLSDNADQPPARVQGTDLSGVADVQKIIHGTQENNNDKFSNLLTFGNDPQPYFYTVVPVKKGSRVVGGAMIAIKVDRMLSKLEKSSEAAITTFYGLDGRPTGSTAVRRDELNSLVMSDTARQELRQQSQTTANSVFDVATVLGREFELAYSPLPIAGKQVGYYAVGLPRDTQFSGISTSRNGIIGIAMALAVGAVLLGYWVSQRITRPLGELVESADAVTAGDLEHRTEITSRDEFGRLAQAFNQMTEHLLRLYRTSRELSAVIEIVPVLDVTAQTLQALVPEIEVLALLNERGEWSYQAASDAGQQAQALCRVRPLPSKPLLQDMAEGRVPTLLTPTDEPRLWTLGLTDAAGFQSLLVTPLLLQSRIVGMLIFAHPQPDAFGGGLLPTLQSIASMTSSVLNNALLFVQVQKDASERQAILRSIADGVIVCDPQRVIVLANNAAEQMFQTPHGALLQRNFDDLALQRVDDVSQEIYVGGQPTQQYLIGQHTVTLSSAPVVSDDGGMLGEVIVLHDTSAEAAVSRAKTNFIEVISHELRTPLTVISGNTELLLRGFFGELNADQRDMLEVMRTRAEHMNNMTKNIITIANIESHTLSTQLEPLELFFAVENAVSSMRSAFAKKQIEVRIDVPRELPSALADREQINLILSQLLDNARKYTPDQGTVVIDGHRADNVIQIDITDSGPGIAPAELERLFTRFHRIRGNDSQVRGSGLGLAIARQLIERLGGQVWATSEPGHGSTFSFVLPVAHEHESALVPGNERDTTA